MGRMMEEARMMAQPAMENGQMTTQHAMCWASSLKRRAPLGRVSRRVILPQEGLYFGLALLKSLGFGRIAVGVENIHSSLWWRFKKKECLFYSEVEVDKEAVKELEDEVRCMLENKGVEPFVLIELIDDIERLGIAYQFQETIDRALERILLQSSQVEQKMHENSHACALYFRLLRQHGYHVSADPRRRDQGPIASTKELTVEIFRSFFKSLVVLSSCAVDDSAQIPVVESSGSSSCFDETKKNSAVKDRRGC
ncbi:Isoprene synthase, chloroplastic [Sesamum alatum]|uniref:Isoprene synthase, chloroplastic n=1 Tax=Sesamum alatum TaxID=300844 RepID=A0AAE1Z5B0_9LAMI|nr:Isoprene synthase, chloroplastic [Sesamum alatum]